jgi:5-methylcytosine-specific restriction endonuclease McrA
MDQAARTRAAGAHARYADHVDAVDAWLDRFGDAMPAVKASDRVPARPGPKPRPRDLVDEWLAIHGEDRRRYLPEHVRQRVFVRDDWTCGLCGGRAYPFATSPHPKLVAVVDHVIPLIPSDPAVDPGTNDEDNLQCAHRYCNGSKRNRAGWHADRPLSETITNSITDVI